MSYLKQAKNILDEYLSKLTTEFIYTDPISIPHLFNNKNDIEIIGFITAIISWGKRENIIKAGKKLANLFENNPYDFLVNASESEMKRFKKFYYRTFQPEDSYFIITKLREIYKNSSLEAIFYEGFQKDGIKGGIYSIREKILSEFPEHRSKKHLPNPYSGSACKRINMFLRWMVRKDSIDFGIWKKIPKSELKIPLDLHVGRTARKLNLLQRRQNDWKAVEELTNVLKKWNPEDPIIYDFALFLYSHNSMN